MTAYASFRIEMNKLVEKLDAADHSVSFTAHIMEMDGSDRSISDYEKALDYAASVRREIGELHDAEMRQRSIDACLPVAR